MSFDLTKDKVKGFIENNMCIDTESEWITYRIFTDVDGNLYDEAQDGTEAITEKIDLTPDERELLGDAVYSVEVLFELAEKFDSMVNRMTDEYIRRFGEVE